MIRFVPQKDGRVNTFIEERHELGGCLCATHEYDISFRVRGDGAIYAMQVTELAYGQWWDWDKEDFKDPVRKKIVAAVEVEYRRQAAA